MFLFILILINAFNVLDILTTWVGIRHRHCELNGLARWAWRRVGFWPVAMFKFLFFLGITWLTYMIQMYPILFVYLLAFLMIFINNVRIINEPPQLLRR